jgi:GH35 family endo-1,4-beta-xylanase
VNNKIATTVTAMRICVFSLVLFVLLSLEASAKVDTTQTNVPALKDVFKKDFNIGCLLSYRNIGLATDPKVPGQSAVSTPDGGYLVKYQMNSMSPGNNMKPVYTLNLTASAAAYNAATTQAAKDSVNLHATVTFNGDLIAQLNWAQRQGFTFRGHTIVWYQSAPTAFFYNGYVTTNTRVTKDVMIQRLDNYIHDLIQTIHAGWPGLLSAIDVVNESVNDNGTFRTGSNEWYNTFGDSTFVIKAFEFARKYTVQLGEPQIKLYYNDYNTDFPAKADGIARLVAPIYQAGLLDGIGLQDHNKLTTPTADQWIATYNKLAPLCNEMAVTELDVPTGTATPSASVLATQANQYGQLFKCYVERSYKSGRGKIISVSKDGLNDAYTMVLQSSSLWDANDICKPAFYAVVDVGNNYNALDSLIKYTQKLQSSSYSTQAWSNITAALASAKTALNQNYSITLSAASTMGAAKDSLISALSAGVTSVSGKNDNVATSFALGQNYPNPFNPTTQISFSLPAKSFATLTVYDIRGREVSRLVSQELSAGSYTRTWDASGMASGVYFYRLQAGTFGETKRLILLR